MRRHLLTFLLFLAPLLLAGEPLGEALFPPAAKALTMNRLAQDSLSAPNDSLSASKCQSMATEKPIHRGRKKDVFHRIGRLFTRFFKEFNSIDTAYIEPQHYNYTAMLQNTNTVEQYSIKSKEGQKVTFSPRPTMKIGPYVGWRWLFLGYSVDVGHLNKGTSKQDFDLSLYSSLLGVDLYYRKTGNNYRIHSVSLGKQINTKNLHNVPFSGLSGSIKGFDMYYVFNHRKFSYPAAFAQSTCQKRSAGTFLLGLGYTEQRLSLNHEALETAIKEHLQGNLANGGGEIRLDSGLMFRQVEYQSYSMSCGYGYNWVLARNLLLSLSASLDIAYKRSKGDMDDEKPMRLKDFRFNDLRFDGVGRFAFVWNNKKTYIGTSAVIHSYNYNKRRFSINSSFGTINVYVGVNFGRK